MPLKIPNVFAFARLVMKRSATEALPDSLRTSKFARLISHPTMGANDGVKAAQGELLLKPKEVDLKDLLNLIAKRIDESKEFSEPVVLRWAGGWVRDRLLGIPSNDIDVAINNMTGEQFLQRAQVIVKAERTKPEEERLECLRGGEDDQTLVRAFKVSANPEKSKHLETSTCTIFEQDVDFVNLRKEVYAEDSRNPQMEFGTAEEDAERRDATINAMFYNITHDQVEDFIGGKEDLQKGLIRTPLEPLKTFTDDPLRVLRLIRFASRYDFAIDENTQKYMYDPSVIEALRNKDKISRERVNIELHKMLEHKHPEIALRWIYDLHLYHVIFTDPKIDNLPRPDISQLPKAMDRMVHLANTKEPGTIGFRLVGTSDYFAWYLVAMLPWMRVLQGLPKPAGMDKKRSFIGHIAYEGFRATVVIQTLLNAARQSVDEILDFKNAVVAGDAWVNDRGVVGLKLRTWQATSGAKWQLCVLNALLMETVEAPKAYADDQAFFDAWMKVLDHLDHLDWKDILLTKPVHGPALKAALGVKKDGKWMKPALNVCLLWQLRNPGSDDLTRAFDEVGKMRKELNIPDS